MDENELQEFTLEDILKEFGEGSDEREESSQEQTELQQEQDQQEPVQEESVQATTDTVRFAPVEETSQDSGVTDATIRLEVIPDVKGKVNNAQIIEDEDEQENIVQEESTEPYSEQWEPDYEQPIGEYVPARPVLIHPRSRFRELKRKLVAGPEKLYYAMSEKGLGKLQAAIFFSVLVVLVSAVATAMFAFGLVQPDRMRLMVFSQFWIMLVSALLGSFQLIEGVADLVRKRFSLNTLLVFTFLICCVDGILCLRQLRVPCCAAFSLQVTMSLWRTYQQRTAMLGQLDTMRKATNLDSITLQENYHQDQSALLRSEGQVEDFMDTLYDSPKQEKVLSIYAMVALGVSVATGIVGAVLHGVSVGVQVAAVTTLAAMPASMFVIFSRPMAVLQKRLHSLGSVLCGWQSVEQLSKKLLFPLDHSDLFPTGNVKLNGVKFYGSRQPDEIIAYATAVVSANGGSLEPLFTGLLDSRNGMHYTAENFRYYEDGGIGGEVNGESVLVGLLPFLKGMGVEVPEGMRISQAVCVAVDGEFCGLFAVAYETARANASGLATLCGYRKLQPVLISNDFMLTEEFIRGAFDVNIKRMLFPQPDVRLEMSQKEPEADAKAVALVTGSGLAPFAYAVTGARSLKSAVVAGVAVHMAGGILGMVMMLVLAILGATQYLTPASMFLYELLWMIPGLLITEWTRSL